MRVVIVRGVWESGECDSCLGVVSVRGVGEGGDCERCLGE